MKEKKNTNTNKPEPNKITRKEALKKAGKYAAFTAASMMIILSPKESQAESGPSKPPYDPW